MTDHPISLDRHRGIAAQKTTELRRQLAEVEANQNALRARQNELEAQLIAASALSWCEAGEKARYLLDLFAAAPVAQDPRRQKLIAGVLEDFAVSRARMEPTPLHKSCDPPGSRHSRRKPCKPRAKSQSRKEKTERRDTKTCGASSPFRKGAREGSPKEQRWQEGVLPCPRIDGDLSILWRRYSAL
jgi:hypothetical protein